MKISMMLLVAGALLAGCKDSGTAITNHEPTPGVYLYKASDPDTRVVVTGALTIAIDDKGAVSGEWAFEKIGSFEETGPQTGTGTLGGSIHNNEMLINLNPGWADNNVLLSGRWERGAWRGTWSWVTFVGPTSGGTFEATPL
jgi:hypothetical protein